MEIADAFQQVNHLNTTLSQTSGTFTVTPTNVLAAAKIIQTQADTLRIKLEGAEQDLRVVPPADDDVSTRMAPAWNDLLLDLPDSYRNRIRDYVQGLDNLASQCAESARTYGYSEEQIAAAFGSDSA
jgi:PE family